ncbi:tyrosine-type recombinase/integrase [Agathobaculum sp.]|uniref:tyrosine-type recombinase/integrase n=1 Tax=Agathobaculum sp. TaxID=2048138 RepID=UPI003A8FF710
MRHTYATDLQSAGVPLNVAKDLLGHQSIAMTSHIYTHLSDEAFTNASLKVLSFATESRKKTQKKVVSIR